MITFIQQEMLAERDYLTLTEAQKRNLIMLPVLDNNHWTDMEVWIFNSIAGSGNKICTYVLPCPDLVLLTPTPARRSRHRQASPGFRLLCPRVRHHSHHMVHQHLPGPRSTHLMCRMICSIHRRRLRRMPHSIRRSRFRRRIWRHPSLRSDPTEWFAPSTS